MKKKQNPMLALLWIKTFYLIIKILFFVVIITENQWWAPCHFLGPFEAKLAGTGILFTDYLSYFTFHISRLILVKLLLKLDESSAFKIDALSSFYLFPQQNEQNGPNQHN